MLLCSADQLRVRERKEGGLVDVDRLRGEELADLPRGADRSARSVSRRGILAGTPELWGARCRLYRS